MSTTQLERGVMKLAASLDREIDELRQKIVDRVVRITESAQDLLARVKSDGADGANTMWIVANMRGLDELKATLADREAQRERIEQIVQFARRASS